MFDTIKNLPGEVFLVNYRRDIYTALLDALGPYTSLLHRRAVMAEGLRVLAGYESTWRWDCGRDTTAGPETPEEEETGAFQVSYNSTDFDPSLGACVARFCGADRVDLFIPQMKAQPVFAVEYASRFLRFTTRANGPLNRGWVQASVSRDAVNEFQTALAG